MCAVRHSLVILSLFHTENTSVDGEAGDKGGSCLHAELQKEQKVEWQDLLKLTSFHLPVSLPWFPGSLLPFHFIFAFVPHICVSGMCASVYVGLHICSCMWRPEVNIASLP